MKKYFLLVAFGAICLLPNTLKAQGYVQNISGNVVSERKFENLEGSVYFNDAYLKGSIMMEDKKIFKDLYLKYDQELDILTYRKSPETSIMQPNDRVVEFTMILPSGEEARFKSIVKGDTKADGFYQVLYDGKTSLLKRTKKKITESLGYNGATKEKSLSSTINYYLLTSDNQLQPIKNDRKSFLKGLATHAPAIDDFINKENINFKSDTDLIKLIQFYNTK